MKRSERRSLVKLGDLEVSFQGLAIGATIDLKKKGKKKEFLDLSPFT